MAANATATYHPVGTVQVDLEQELAVNAVAASQEIKQQTIPEVTIKPEICT
jgi:hypothetical protein